MSAEPSKSGRPSETVSEGAETIGPDATGVFETVAPAVPAPTFDGSATIAPAPAFDGSATVAPAPTFDGSATVAPANATGVFEPPTTVSPPPSISSSRGTQALAPGGTQGLDGPIAPFPSSAGDMAGTVNLVAGAAVPPGGETIAPPAAPDPNATGVFSPTIPIEPGRGPSPGAPTIGAATGEYTAVVGGAAAPPRGRAEQPTIQATGEYVVGGAGGGAGVGAGDATAMVEAVGGYDRTLAATQAGDRHAGKPAPRYDPNAPRCGRYMLKHFHAKGGMGEIWMAEDTVIGRPVALKRMLGQRPDQVHRFLVEAQVTGQLEHPGIVPVHELGTNDQGQPFYTMKFVQGRTLQKIVEEYHAIPPGSSAYELERLRLLQIFVALCQTVGYAHSRGVLHRDLKPENVMLGPYGETVLLDWGIAKIMGQPDRADDEVHMPLVSLVDASDDEDTQTRAGAIMGTPSYMSPEVALGKNDEVDQRSDVYLLGATLYEIVTGRQPRRAKTAMEMIKLAQKEPPPPASKVNPRVPKALESICRKAMEHDRNNRYATALELADDVQRFVAGEPVSAHPEGFAARAWRWARRNRKTLGRAAAALAVVSVVTFSVVAVQHAQRETLKAKRDADGLRQQEQARHDLREFRRLADEARFYAATTDPVGEHAPYFDPKQGESTALAALAMASKWGPSLDGLPLVDEREPVKHDLYDLLLVTAQLKNRKRAEPVARADPVALVFLLSPAVSGSPAAAAATNERSPLALLDEAARLREPSRGLYRLRAELYEQLGEPAKAKDDAERAADPARPVTYLDHFLLGEKYRNEAAGREDPKEERKMWQPDPARMEQAIDEYREAVRLSPEHYWSHYQLGRCYLGLGRLDEAVEALGSCVALRPKAPWGYSVRGLALLQQKRYREAEQDLHEAVRLDPESRTSHLNRGYVYAFQGKRDLALTEFDAALQPPKDKQVVEAAFQRGRLYLELGEVTKALNDFALVIREIPDFKEVYIDRARVYVSQGKYDLALADLDQFRDLIEGRRMERQGWLLHARRGRLLRLMYSELPGEKRAQPAGRALLSVGLSELMTAVKMRGKVARELQPQLFDDTGAMLYLSGRLPEALQAYTVGLQLDPNHVRMRIKRGWALLEANKPAAAMEDFKAAIKADPLNAEAHSGLGYVDAVGKQRDDAQHEAELALILGIDNYMAVHNAACTFAKLSETPDEAKAAANQEVAMTLIRRTIDLWKKGGKVGRNAIIMIKQEEAFKPLADRKDFQELIKDPA